MSFSVTLVRPERDCSAAATSILGPSALRLSNARCAQSLSGTTGTTSITGSAGGEVVEAKCLGFSR